MVTSLMGRKVLHEGRPAVVVAVWPLGLQAVCAVEYTDKGGREFETGVDLEALTPVGEATTASPKGKRKTMPSDPVLCRIGTEG